MVKVKICGITNLEDALTACEHETDYLGFVFVPGTPRAVSMDTVKAILHHCSGKIKIRCGLVGLFKDDQLEYVADTLVHCGLDHVQLHGHEHPDYCLELRKNLEKRGHHIKIIKSFKIKDGIMPIGWHGIDDYNTEVDYFVFDTFHPEIHGGTGIKFDWEVLKKEKPRIKKPFFIAGGLTPANVAEAVRVAEPYGVDVSSGVESAVGKKDADKVKEFIENAKEAEETAG